MRPYIRHDKAGISQIIATLLMVALTLVVAASSLIWFTSFSDMPSVDFIMEDLNDPTYDIYGDEASDFVPPDDLHEKSRLLRKLGNEPRPLAIEAKESLESLYPTGDNDVDKKLVKTIEHLDKCLSEEYWLNDTHIKKKDVLDELKKGSHDLWGAIKKSDGTYDEVAYDAMLRLLTAADLLVFYIYGDAEPYAFMFPKVADHLEKCDEEQMKALEDLSRIEKKTGDPEPHYEKAIDHYKHAWEDAYKAIKYINKMGARWVPDDYRVLVHDKMYQVQNMIDSGLYSEDANEKMEKAVEEFYKVMFESGDDAAIEFEKAIDKVKHGMDNIEDAFEKGAPTVSIMEELLAGTDFYAKSRIEDASLMVGADDKDVMEAWGKYYEGLYKIDEGKWDDAMGKFKDVAHEVKDALD